MFCIITEKMIPRNASKLEIKNFSPKIHYNAVVSGQEIILTSVSIPNGTILSVSYNIGRMCCRKIRISCKVVD